MRKVYQIAAYFREWNVEGEGGFLSRISYEQLWTWIEFDRLDPFTSWREDFRSAQIVSKIHNVNVINQSDLSTPKDFMLESMEEIIERERQEEESKRDLESNQDAARSYWNMYMTNLTAGRKPVQDTFKG